MLQIKNTKTKILENKKEPDEALYNIYALINIIYYSQSHDRQLIL